MKQRKGLPGKLEEETVNALRPIFLKYLSMKKPHMSRYRIIGIMLDAFHKSLKDNQETP